MCPKASAHGIEQAVCQTLTRYFSIYFNQIGWKWGMRETIETLYVFSWCKKNGQDRMTSPNHYLTGLLIAPSP